MLNEFMLLLAFIACIIVEIVVMTYIETLSAYWY